MTLMRIDRPQSPTHKGGFLQGGKSTTLLSQNNNNNANNHTNHQRKGSPPPPPGKHHHNNNNNNDVIASSNKKGSNSDRSSAQQQQQQQQQQPSSNSSRYKTELCRPFEENGTCKYGDKCQFAHGAKELRSMARHPKYKTELCRTFHSTGLCPYGPRCHFIHNSEQTKKSLMTTLARAKPLDSTGESPPASRGGTPTSPRTFSDLYASPNNVFFAADNLLSNFQQPLYEYNGSSPDLYDSINVFNDKRMDLDNHSFQPVLDLFPLDQQPMTPTSPIDANIFRLPIFDAFKKL